MPEHQGRRKSSLSREDGWFDRVFMALVHRVSGWTIAIVALAFYPGIGLVAPLLLGWSTLWLVYANLFGVLWASTLTVGWLVVQLENSNRRHLVEWTTDLRHLNAEEFEWFVGEVFRREGWGVTETGRQDRADGNIDLVLTNRRARRLVQCKRWTSRQVGIDEIRAFAGTIAAERKADTKGTFVTLSDFTEAAVKEAKRTGIELLGRRELFDRVERVRRPEPCPICHEPMTLDRSQHGWWFRCKARGCSGKRDLTGEPARVVELLTERPWTSAGVGVDA